MRKVNNIVLLCTIFLSSETLACAFDLDCMPGSKCIKPPASLFGVCAGGMFPGNSFDSEPVVNPLDLNQTFGNTCSFNLDCGLNMVCAKQQGNILGVCLPSKNR